MSGAREVSSDADASGSSGNSDAGQRGLRVCLLGEFRVVVGGWAIEASAWRRSKARGLIKLLALSPRHRMHRDEIIEHLWPELDPDVGAANLRVVLHAIRQALQVGDERAAPFVQSVGDEIELRHADLWVDVEAFERAAMAALRSRAVEGLRKALDLYTGELLPEDRYEDWASARRERLRGLHLSLLGSLAAALEESGDSAGAIDALEQIVAADPTDEGVARRLMLAYARAGQRHRALRLFRQVRDALQRDLDTTPEPETQQIYGEILAGGASGAVIAPEPAAESVQRHRHNLRIPLTSFIGREREMERVWEQLGAARLLTLSGPAGSGKTRLALAAGLGLLESFEDGVWFVDLGALVSAEPIVSTISGAVGVTLDASQPEQPALVDALREKQALLILDNCEHLIEACARITEDLLQECAGLRVLATSREPLHIAGEAVLRVPALLLPEERTTLEHVRSSDAVLLFLDRARALQPDFEMTEANATVVADICRRLDGLPLAIELAAARAPVLSLEQLERRLSDPLRVLTGGSRTAEPRQQTLRATLDWSFEALDDAEQRLLERLSVFAGEWTLEAAESVCAGDGIAEADVLTLLAQLVDKSLLEVRAGSGEARYRLLVTIRQYARERHEARGEGDALQRRLADYCVALAEAAGSGLLGAEQAAWLERLELELDNVRAALDWCERAGEVERQLRIAASLVRMWWIRGYTNEGRRWLEGALRIARERPELDPGVQAKGLQAAGNLARMQGDIEQAQQHLEACLALQREHGAPSELAHALNYLAALLGLRGDLTRAIALAEEGLGIFRELGEQRGVALTLGTLGEVTFAAGDAPQSSQYLEEALLLGREIGDTHSIAITLNNLGEALRAQGLLDHAAARFEESLAIFRELEATHGVAYLLANLGDIARGRGRDETARLHYLEALEVFHGLGYRQAVLSVVANLAALGARSGDADRAAHLLGAEEALREDAGFVLTPVERMEIDEALATARSRLGEEAFERGWQAGREMSLDAVVTLAGTVDLNARVDVLPVQLSPRERDVALLVARGMTNQQVAGALGMSVRTAETHVGNALRKLGLGSRRELGEWAREQRLVV